jgi:hypothetical protein
MAREPISPKLRFEILNRDRFTCRYCGQSAPNVDLEVDHIHPVALGGSNDRENLQTACRTCNSGKRATPLVDLAAFKRAETYENRVCALADIVSRRYSGSSYKFAVVLISDSITRGDEDWQPVLSSLNAPTWNEWLCLVATNIGWDAGVRQSIRAIESFSEKATEATHGDSVPTASPDSELRPIEQEVN